MNAVMATIGLLAVAYAISQTGLTEWWQYAILGAAIFMALRVGTEREH